MTKDTEEDLQIDSALMQYALDDPPPDEPPPPRKRKRGSWRRDFTKVPRIWEVRLAQIRRTVTYILAHELLYQGWRSGRDIFSAGQPITVSGEAFRALNISKKSMQRALTDLEKAGLIRVERGPGHASRVTLLLTKVCS